MTFNVADVLDGLELFQEFSYPELKLIGRFLTKVEKKQGAVVFAEGDPGDYILILAEGRLSIFKGGEHGSHLLCHEGRGRIVGEMALLDRERRSATCMADTDCTMLTLNDVGLRQMADEAPLLAYRFMFNLAKLLSRRLRRTSGMLVEYLSV
ncbi:MAG: cyclic nucleotide-binding domain-containing protein [Rhodocyclaceae bacterium]|nr:cyclic nucleotide-binding domain-containing protein [Rhodocyclaceae bacterium]MDZ4216278.1 cyclic nucleotide-binding domain-containing protein [Rhodocyclaceae bacterium]